MKYINEAGVNKNENKKVIGKMKDEISNSVMTEIVALQAKVYSYVTDNQKHCKKLKGVKNHIKITHDEYK